MAEDDIYGNKAIYENFKKNIHEICLSNEVVNTRFRHRIYYCKNHENLKYFTKLINYFENLDLSYIRRIRILRALTFISNFVTKDLSECEREDIDLLLPEIHKTTITDIKHTSYMEKVLARS